MLIVVLLYVVPLSILAQQVTANRQQKFPKDVPAGNYSAITPLGNDRYAIVSDKTTDGFYVFHISIDSLSGRILSVANEGFQPSGRPNRDQEGIAFRGSTATLFISGEADNQVLEYNLNGTPTGNRLCVPPSFQQLDRNHGLEALCYDNEACYFYTIAECPAKGDSLLRLTAFDDTGLMRCQYAYALDTIPQKRRGMMLNGVSDVCSLGGGRLIVLERTLRVPPLKIGSYADCRLYLVHPQNDLMLHKKLIYRFRTRINLLRRNFANYEGLCLAHRLKDGRLVLLLVADSQNRYGNVLRDWFKTIVISDDGL